MPRARNVRFAVLSVLLLLLGQTGSEAAIDPFETYDCIGPNVAFWKKIYSQYSTSQGVVHDSRNLDIIYEIIDLKPYDAPGARRINRSRMKRVKKKYEKILARLAHNPEANDADARRVAELFGHLASTHEYRRAADRVRCQVGQKDRFSAGLIRSGAYLDKIMAIFRFNGLPEDLAYLPHVESSFNPKAYSKFGAAGIWQFTRSTGKRFMEVGYVLDERRDPIRATHAAAQLLKENYNKLGSWPLAITAYNHGATGMRRAKSKLGDYPAIFKSYRSRIFKFASRNFYSEFLAAREVAKNYQAYFGALALDQPGNTQTLTLDGYVSFEDLCNHFGLNSEQLKELNPALRSPVFSGQKYIPRGYTLRLPALHQGAAEGGQGNGLLSALYRKKQKPSRFYTVQRGDTAGRIARLHGVPLSDLILANNLNRRATIYPRQTLRIPLPGESITPPSEPPSESSALVLAADIRTKPESESVPVVQNADTPLYQRPVLASVIPLPLIEDRPESSEAPAQSVTPEEPKPSMEIVAADVHIHKIYKENGRPVGLIQVEVEETLGHYAEWANIRTWQIRHLNDLRYGDVLNLHQKIRVPLHRVDPQAFAEKRYEYHKRLQEDFFAVYRIDELQPYYVQRGDNYWKICRDKFSVPMWLLKHCNPEIDLASLNVHGKLLIPIVKKVTADEPGTGAPEMDQENLQDEIEEQT